MGFPPPAAASYTVSPMTQLLGWRQADPAAVRAAAWVARCVGRGEAAPLRPQDLAALATYLRPRELAPGEVAFTAGRPAAGAWIVRAGLLELAVGSGRRRAVVALLRPGDVDGDIHLLLEMAPPYTARAAGHAECLSLEAATFERPLREHPAIARRWLSSVAARLARPARRGCWACWAARLSSRPPGCWSKRPATRWWRCHSGPWRRCWACSGRP
jgi:hypothetical protein